MTEQVLKKILFVVALTILLCASAQAQWVQCTNQVITCTTSSVGIGTTSPLSPLHVTGIIRSDDRIDSRRGGSDSAATGSGFFLGDGGADWVGLQLSSGNNLDFWTQEGSWLRRMTLTSGGRLGIGTATPGALLSVTASGSTPPMYVSGAGTAVTSSWSYLARFEEPTNSRGVTLGYDTTAQTGIISTLGGISNLAFWTHDGVTWAERMRVGATGNVGIGTVLPAARMHVADGTPNAWTVLAQASTTAGQSYGMAIHAGTNSSDAAMAVFNRAATGNPFLFVRGDGNVGVGTNAPAATFDVNGTIHAVGDISSSGRINAKFQDVAEWVPATDDFAPGTVVVLDEEHANTVRESSSAYDEHVAGVVSASPGVVLGESGTGKSLVATTGRVRVKADASQASIKIGDLLVTSDKTGLAMKSVPINVGGRRMHAPGTILGKALEPLSSGEGEILVLLTLQ
jgi:hypothetical protein